MNKKYLLAGIIILVIVVVVLAISSNKGDVKPQKILVAGNIPLTGGLSVYGEYIKDGSELGYKDLKDQYKDVLPIVFDWQDNQGDSKSAVSVFQKQYSSSDKPDIYISGLKPQTAAITNLVTEKGTPHFTWILDVLINPNSKNNIRTWVNFKKEAGVFVNYLKDKKLTKIYILYANTDAADEEYEGIVRPALIKMGLKNENISSEAFNLDKSDFRDTALKIKQFNPDYIIINGFIPHLVSIVKDFRLLGVIKNGNTIASLDMLDAAALISKENLESIVVATPSFLVGNDSVELKNWKDNFKKTYNREATYHDAYAYDGVKVILEAAKNLNLPATSAEWIKASRSVKTTGVTGSIEFDEDGSSITTMYPAVYKDGKLVPIK